jgi:hypothetical protein
MKNDKQSNKPAYEITRVKTARSYEGYEDLKIILLMRDGWTARDYKRAVTIKWQAHQRSNHSADGGPSDWYAHNLAVMDSDRFYEIETAFMMLKRLTKLMEHKERTPERTLEALEALKWERMVYDPRKSHHVPVGEVLPPEYSAWMFAYDKMGEKHNPCGFVFAKDRDDAQQMMEHELVKDLSYGVAERLKLGAKWIEAGRPVECMSGRYGDMYSAPEVKPTGLLLLSPKAEARAKAEAEAKAASMAVEMVVSG